jgi:hypothetical protein
VERLGQVRKRVQKQAQIEGQSSVSLPVASESRLGGDDTDATEFSLARFKHVVDVALMNTTDAIIAIKEDFSLVYLNPSAEVLLDAPVQEAVGMP